MGLGLDEQAVPDYRGSSYLQDSMDFTYWILPICLVCKCVCKEIIYFVMHLWIYHFIHTYIWLLQYVCVCVMGVSTANS